MGPGFPYVTDGGSLRCSEAVHQAGAGLEGVCGLDWFKEAGMTYRRNFAHALVEGDIKTKEKILNVLTKKNKRL